MAGLDSNDPGDTDTGPNTLLNYPEITAASGHDIRGRRALAATSSSMMPSGIPPPSAAGALT